MKSNRILTIAALAIVAAALIAMSGCKTSGMAVTRHGQFLKINIEHPEDLPEQGEGNVNIVLGNRGVRSVRDVLVDIELPQQLIIVDETHERGVTMTHDPARSPITTPSATSSRPRTRRFTTRCAPPSAR